ncbi:hypothetical protein SBA4_2310049 [Candidatus Sulfopaludibacter sp. SbA4]|nr:hypothetical protein SBA4_2310049 [Candidatus Sulfopaludibacter sp. SbA4]
MRTRNGTVPIARASSQMRSHTYYCRNGTDLWVPREPFIGNILLSSPADNKSHRLATARVRASPAPIETWRPGVRTESRPSKCSPWRPLASKQPSANPFAFSGDLRKSLIFLKWHGRGREFESHQVHQKPIHKHPHADESSGTLNAGCSSSTPAESINWTVPRTSMFGSSRATRQSSARLWRWPWNIMSINSATDQIISDWRDLLSELETGQVRFLVVGGYAVMKYTEPYNTKDLDLWIDPAPENAGRPVPRPCSFRSATEGRHRGVFHGARKFLPDRGVTLARGHHHFDGRQSPIRSCVVAAGRHGSGRRDGPRDRFRRSHCHQTGGGTAGRLDRCQEVGGAAAAQVNAYDFLQSRAPPPLNGRMTASCKC